MKCDGGCNLTLFEWASVVIGLLWAGGLASYEVVKVLDIKSNSMLSAIKPFTELTIA